MTTTNPKVLWARKELSSRLKGISDNTTRKGVFKKVWADAKKKFG